MKSSTIQNAQGPVICLTIKNTFLTLSSSYRLRYHGSYLSPVPTKSNGDLTKAEPKIEPKVEKEERKNKPERLKLNWEEFTFSFETVPENEKWYKTFRRQDLSEQRYDFGHNCESLLLSLFSLIIM